MRYRRFVCFLLGIWIGVSAMLALAVYQNFNTVDGILRTPPQQASTILKVLGTEDARKLLRYTAGMENVNTFETWEDFQFALGLLVSAILFLESSTRGLSAVPLSMTLLVAFLHFKITPELAWLDHMFAFGSWTAESQARDQFWKLHGIYTILDAIKDLIGFVFAVFLFSQRGTKHTRRGRHRRESGRLQGASG